MRWQGRRESDNVEDRRNSSDSQGMGRGPGFRIPSGKGGIIFRSGTDAFAECLQRIDLDRRADLRRSSREGLSLVQPRYVVVHHHRR